MGSPVIDGAYVYVGLNRHTGTSNAGGAVVELDTMDIVYRTAPPTYTATHVGLLTSSVMCETLQSSWTGASQMKDGYILVPEEGSTQLPQRQIQFPGTDWEQAVP